MPTWSTALRPDPDRRTENIFSGKKTKGSRRTLPVDDGVLGEMRTASLNSKSIQRRLGHATISETSDTYGHLFPDDEDLGRGAIDAKIEKDLTEQEGSMNPQPLAGGVCDESACRLGSNLA